MSGLSKRVVPPAEIKIVSVNVIFIGTYTYRVWSLETVQVVVTSGLTTLGSTVCRSSPVP